MSVRRINLNAWSISVLVRLVLLVVALTLVIVTGYLISAAAHRLVAARDFLHNWANLFCDVASSRGRLPVPQLA